MLAKGYFGRVVSVMTIRNADIFSIVDACEGSSPVGGVSFLLKKLFDVEIFLYRTILNVSTKFLLVVIFCQKIFMMSKIFKDNGLLKIILIRNEVFA